MLHMLDMGSRVAACLNAAISQFAITVVTNYALCMPKVNLGLSQISPIHS